MTTRGTLDRRWIAVPGLVTAIGVAVGALAVSPLARTSPLVLALASGIALGNTGVGAAVLAPGLRIAARTLLRLGIVLLGLRLSLTALTEAGGRVIVAVLLTVLVAMSVTYGLMRRIGTSKSMATLTAAGFGICGQTAIAAIAPVSGADEEEVAYAVGIVAALGTIAVFTLPLIDRVFLHLAEHSYGAWVGISVHDTSQVVAAAGAAGSTAVASATLIKLTRVLLLGPVLVAVTWLRGEMGSGRQRGSAEIRQLLRASVPWFVVGFIGAMLVRTAGWLPASWLTVFGRIETCLLAAAMVGLGWSIRLGNIRTLGTKPLIAGLAAWVGIAAFALLVVDAAHL